MGCFAAVPAVMLAIIVADLRLGLFPLDTFYGVLGPVALAPAYFVVNLALLCVFA